MNSNWKECTLGDVVNLKRGFDLPARDRRAGKIPLISSSGTSDCHDEPRVQGPGVVTGRYGTIGNVYFSEGPFWPLNTTLFVENFKGNDPRFIYFFLKTIDYSKYSDKGAVPGVNRNDLHTALISIPNLTEQKKIASFLGCFEDRITLLRATNATLEAIAQALFKSWFVDFDPVHAKQQGRAPEGMDDATAALFPDSFEDADVELVPRGWYLGKVEDLMELAYGKALKTSDRTEGPVPVYGSGGITGYHNQPLVSSPSIVIGRKGTVGSLYWEDRPFFPIDTVFYVKTSKPLSYCYYLLQTLHLEDMNTDAAVPGLNRNNAYRLQTVIPPDTLIEEFDKIASSLHGKFFANNQQLQTLATLRDTLLPRLISGQLRLPEAEATLEKAAA